MRPRDLTPKKSMTRIENDENERGNTLDNKIITVLQDAFKWIQVAENATTAHTNKGLVDVLEDYDQTIQRRLLEIDQLHEEIKQLQKNSRGDGTGKTNLANQLFKTLSRGRAQLEELLARHAEGEVAIKEAEQRIRSLLPRYIEKCTIQNIDLVHYGTFRNQAIQKEWNKTSPKMHDREGSTFAPGEEINLAAVQSRKQKMEMILQKKRHQHSKDMSDLIAKLKFLEGEHALLENKIVRLNKEVEAKQGYKTQTYKTEQEVKSEEYFPKNNIISEYSQ